jgi:uncharacterized membrane protein
MLDAIVHTLHIILAGVWLGGVVFTTTVVSPALKSMGWDEAEQARVRSVIGHQYAKVGTANLVLLLVVALMEGALSGFGFAPGRPSRLCCRNAEATVMYNKRNIYLIYCR